MALVSKVSLLMSSRGRLAEVAASRLVEPVYPVYEKYVVPMLLTAAPSGGGMHHF